MEGQTKDQVIQPRGYDTSSYATHGKPNRNDTPLISASLLVVGRCNKLAQVTVFVFTCGASFGKSPVKGTPGSVPGLFVPYRREIRQ